MRHPSAARDRWHGPKNERVIEFQRRPPLIRATSAFDGPLITLNASVSGPVVYLDNWAIGELAAAAAFHRRGALRHGPAVLGHERRGAFGATGQIGGFRESVLGRNWAALVPRETRPD